MAIKITDNFQLRQKNFLDDRQGIASSVSALKSWDFSKVPIPEGFEVYVNGIWYIYRSSHDDDPITGKFKDRSDSDGVNELKVRVTRLEFEDERYVASNFEEIKTESFWLDSTGVNHARPGRIVTITDDGDKNGPWYLISSDYTRTDSWIKLIGRGDLVTTTGGAHVSDTSVYTSLRSDALFPKKDSREEIRAEWVFKEDQVFEKDLTANSINANTGTIRDLKSTSSETQNLTTQVANIGEGTVTTLNSTTGTITTLNSTNSSTTNQTVTGDLKTNNLQATGNTELEKVEIGENGSIKDEDGKTVARVDKIVAEESEIADLDQQIRDHMGLVGVNNLLKNTSFLGQFESKNMKTNTSLGEETDVYNSKIDDWEVTTGWEVVVDSDSITGYSMRLGDSFSILSQETSLNLNKGESYILSWKQKGDIQVEVSDYDIEVHTIFEATDYKSCYADVIPSETGKKRITFKGGPGYVFEIKFEAGIIPTSWSSSSLDTDPIASRVDSYEFLKTSFLEYLERSHTTVSGVYLKDQIKVGDIVDDVVRSVWGGISGTYIDKSDVMLWSGGTYGDALDLISKIESNPDYLDKLTESTLRDLVKVIITFGSKTVLTDVYAVGKFKGRHLDSEGLEITSFHKITGFLPGRNGEGLPTGIGFTAGRLNRIDGIYPDTVNFNGVEIQFSNGFCTNQEGQYRIPGGSVAEYLYLIFHKGYLVSVNSTDDHSAAYFWY